VGVGDADGDFAGRGLRCLVGVAVGVAVGVVAVTLGCGTGTTVVTLGRAVGAASSADPPQAVSVAVRVSAVARIVGTARWW
jgi:uncharacterized membrane protein YfcA